MPRVACIGEVMVEFSPVAAAAQSGDSYQLGFAGDTFNTAVTLARLGIATSYVTLLGEDPFSDRILNLMAEENLAADLVTRLPDQQPGLYVIANTPSGERSFSYWRNASAARQLWMEPKSTARCEAALKDFDCIYLSGITLAIMQPEARERLRDYLSSYRQSGGKLAFDSNFRLRLWRSIGEARAVIADFLAIADIALLTLEDEQVLWGEESAETIIAKHRERSIREIVIKQGGAPVLICDGDKVFSVDVPPVATVVDTTGAGDAFNAGYLALSLQGADSALAVTQGNKAASAVIRWRGGIVPRDYFLQEMGGALDARC